MKLKRAYLKTKTSENRASLEPVVRARVRAEQPHSLNIAMISSHHHIICFPGRLI
jgi:hypothetical protein